MKKNNLFLKGLVTFIVIIFVIASVNITPVSAAPPSMFVSPASQTVLNCEESVIAIRVTDIYAPGLYGYDVKVSFPVGKLEVVGVSNATFLDNTGYYIRNQVDVISGNVQVWVAYTQLAPSTHKTGDGDLIYIRVRALTTGETVPITITYQKLATGTGQSIDIPSNRIFNGTVTLSDDCPPVALTINPAETLVCQLGEDTIINVNVRYAVNLWAYDLQLSFDPKALNILEVKNGSFLQDGIYGARTWDNDAGTIWFAMSQINPQSPKSGAGTLLTIRMRPKPDQLNKNVRLTITSGTELIDSSILNLPYTTADGMLYTNACDPTSADLTNFTARDGGRSVTLRWETTNELDNLGFNIYRANFVNGKRVKVNDLMIPSKQPPGSMVGSLYIYVDTGFTVKPGNGGGGGTVLHQAKNGRTYYYWLETVSVRGDTELNGPVEVRVFNKQP